MDTIRVQVAEPDMGTVALGERHPDHPEGEVFIVGRGEVEVALTPAVASRLQRGELVEVAPRQAAPPKQEVEPAERPQRPAAAVEQAPVEAEEAKPPRKGVKKGGL